MKPSLHQIAARAIHAMWPSQEVIRISPCDSSEAPEIIHQDEGTNAETSALLQRPQDQELAAADRGVTHQKPRFVLQWHITDRCNLRCSHCYQDNEPMPELPLPHLLDILQQFKRLLAHLESQNGAPLRAQVNVTGGEPFIRSDFFSLLSALAAEQPRIAFGILTNGAFIDDKAAERLRHLGPRMVQLSVEGEQPTHDHIRGSGDFARLCQFQSVISLPTPEVGFKIAGT